MKKFFLLRHEDVHNNSGCGVVAEGVMFRNGKCSMTWLTHTLTVTNFDKFADIEFLHGHGGKTEVITEDNVLFKSCETLADEWASKRKAA